MQLSHTKSFTTLTCCGTYVLAGLGLIGGFKSSFISLLTLGVTYLDDPLTEGVFYVSLSSFSTGST